jgi:tetratricopeptide (TPR) repeat protein
MSLVWRCALTAFLSLLVGEVSAQQVRSLDLIHEGPWAIAVTLTGDNTGDPGYALYKEGYNLILGEKWDDARKTFHRLLEKFPKSEYRDDAAYWSAYALKFTNAAQALDAYRKFINEYHSSSYYDDAVADFNSLQPLPPGSPAAPRNPRPPKAPRPEEGYSYSFAVAPDMRVLERQMRTLKRRMRMLPPRLDGVRALGGFPGEVHAWKDLDPDTRIKMEALYAISESPDDEKAFTTLRTVALDRAKPVQLRLVALDALSQYEKFDPLPVYLAVARNDTSSLLQTDAIAYIGEVSKDKGRSVDVLVDLYQSLPPGRDEPRQTIFYSIAEIGNDRAVDFLSSIARTDSNYQLRREAVYFLGNIGSERSRDALYQILQSR